MSKQKQRADRIAKLQGSPAEFRNALVIERDDGPAKLGEVLDDWQKEDFEQLDLPWWHVAFRKGEPKYKYAWLERPRGHSKTGDLAVMVAWVLFASPRLIRGQAAAADRNQAKLLRDQILSLVAMNPWLSQFLNVQQFRVANVRTNSELEIISSDVPGGYGGTPDFIVADEVCHWIKEDLWAILTSSAIKQSHCILVAITNAGFQESWQWQRREDMRTDPEAYFHALDGPKASWISPKDIESQRRKVSRVAFQRLWLNQWSSGSGDALDPIDLDAAIHTTPTTDHPAEGWVYTGGIDLGLKRDASALVVVGRHVGHCETIHKERPKSRGPMQAAFDCGLLEPDEYQPDDDVEYRDHPGTGRLAVCEVEIWKPGTDERVSLTEIEEKLKQLDALYHFCAVGADPWQAAMLCERLQAAGVAISPIDFVANNLKEMASVVLEAFRERTLELPDCHPLIRDLQKLRVTEKSYGVRLESPRDGTGHGDAATALAISLLVSKRTASAPPPRIDGPLVCWP